MIPLFWSHRWSPVWQSMEWWRRYYLDRSGFNTDFYKGNSQRSANDYVVDSPRKTDKVNTGITLKTNDVGGQALDIRPPYYVLAYIIKLSY